MRSRMERYVEENEQSQYSRSNKNQELYQNIGTNQRYTNFTDVTNANAIDLDRAKQNSQTREGYHQMKEYGPVIPNPKGKRELEEFNYLYQDHENRVYDINSVLEEARKNRAEKDELEEKRKLKNTNYNILAGLNPEQLEQYRKEKQERTKKPNEEELRELIDTITSKTLAGEIDKATSVNLLSDLMATNVLKKVSEDETSNISQETEEKEESENDDKLSLSKEILDKDQINKMKQVKDKTPQQEVQSLKEADNDFYTRSMDLSDKDFEMANEFKEKKVPLPVKIILIIIILVVLAIAGYFIWKSF